MKSFLQSWKGRSVYSLFSNEKALSIRQAVAQHRWLAITVSGILGIGLIFAFFHTGKNTSSAKGTQIGDFWLPDLAGWKKEVSRVRVGEEVTFTRRVDDVTMSIVFNCMFGKVVKLPATKQSLKDQQLFEKKHWSKDNKRPVLRSYDTVFRAYPALMEYRRYIEKGTVVDIKNLKFVDGKNHYRISQIQSVRGGASSRAENALYDSWNYVTQELQPTKNR